MNYIEQVRRDDVEINSLLMNVGKTPPRLGEERRKVPRSRALIFLLFVLFRFGSFFSRCWNWFLDNTLRRKHIVRGRRRLMKLAGLDGVRRLQSTAVEKVGSIDYSAEHRQMTCDMMGCGKSHR